MEFFQRLLAWIIVIAACLSFGVIILFIVFCFLLYELSPNRRRRLFEYQTAILALLAKNGEMRGRDLWCDANIETKMRFSRATFYTLMAELEDEEMVEVRNLPEVIEVDDERVSLMCFFYRLTDRGRTVPVKRPSVRRALQSIPGRWVPAPI